MCSSDLASNPPSGLPVVMTLGLHEGDGAGLAEPRGSPSAVVHAAASATNAASAAMTGSGRGCRRGDLIELGRAYRTTP